jgi:hypothetical protein
VKSLFVCLVGGASVALAGPAPKPLPVSGLAVRSVALACGGARPDPGEPTSREEPEVKVRFVARAGPKNTKGLAPVTFTTDEKGRFSTQLPFGTWCVVPASRSELPPSEVAAQPTPGARPLVARGDVDLACLDALWAECTAVLNVGPTGLQNVKLTTFVGCGWSQPCQRTPSPPPP